MVSFEFVVQSQDVYQDGFSSDTRTRIRKQAMKKVGAERRKGGGYGKRNLRQQPIVVEDIIYSPVPSAVVKSTAASTASGDEAEGQPSCWSLQIRSAHPAAPSSSSPSSASSTSSTSSDSPSSPSFANPCRLRQMPLSGVDRLVADYGINPVHFSALTNVHLGGVAVSVLARQPHRLQGLLSDRTWSYFSFVPARYGQHPYLDDALRCLVVKARAIMAPSAEADKMILAAYGKALQSLQKAVQDPSLVAGPDVLGATGILSVFEVSCACRLR
jgi:hypothetical protein